MDKAKLYNLLVNVLFVVVIHSSCLLSDDFHNHREIIGKYLFVKDGFVILLIPPWDINAVLVGNTGHGIGRVRIFEIGDGIVELLLDVQACSIDCLELGIRHDEI